VYNVPDVCSTPLTDDVLSPGHDQVNILRGSLWDQRRCLL